jgi:hypothetical protein
MYLNAVYGKYAIDNMTGSSKFTFGWGTRYMQYLEGDAYKYDDGNDRLDVFREGPRPSACI